MTIEPHAWCAMIYVADSRDVAGAVRRSKRLHWKQADARREVERWVTEMRLDPVRWETADDETVVGRIPGTARFISSVRCSKEHDNATATRVTRHLSWYANPRYHYKISHSNAIKH